MGAEVFVDTSAIYAVLIGEDQNHAEAKVILAALEQRDALLVSSSFVLHESIALLQARSGLQAVQQFREAIQPLLDVVWVTEDIYQRSMSALLAADSRRISLADWSSFQIMRERGLKQAFAFDQHFRDQGFETLTGKRK